MKPIRSTIPLLALLALSLSSTPLTLFAQTAAVPADIPVAAPVSDKKGGPVEYEGNITSINLATNTVTVASTTKLMVLSITSSTKLRKNKVKVKLTDFGLGDMVSGSYSKDSSGKLTAYSLRKNTTPAPVDATPAAPASGQ